MRKLLLICLMTLGSASAFSHGEDTPGPHGGEIRMPGSFHTEVVQVAPNKVLVYLLDELWENPTVASSKVKLKYVGSSTSNATCMKVKESFSCSFNASVDLNKKGTLEIEAVRNMVSGTVVKYQTPFKFKPTEQKDKNKKNESHSHEHEHEHHHNH